MFGIARKALACTVLLGGYHLVMQERPTEQPAAPAPTKTVYEADGLPIDVTVTVRENTGVPVSHYQIEAGPFEIAASEDFSQFIVKKDRKAMVTEIISDDNEILRSYSPVDGYPSGLLTICRDRATDDVKKVWYTLNLPDPDGDAYKRLERYVWVDKDADGLWDDMLDHTDFLSEGKLDIYQRESLTNWSKTTKQVDMSKRRDGKTE